MSELKKETPYISISSSNMNTFKNSFTGTLFKEDMDKSTVTTFSDLWYT